MRVVCATITALSLVVASAGPASAFCERKFGEYGKAKWTKLPVKVYLSNNLDEAAVASMKAAIDESFSAWAAVSCSALDFEAAGSFDPATTPWPGPQVTPPNDPKMAIYVYLFTTDAGWPAEVDKNSVHFSEAAHDGFGQLIRGAIAINAFRHEWATDGAAGKVDVRNEMMPMIGKLIGLDDSDVADAVMRKRDSIQLGDTSLRELNQDDMDAARYVYPEEGCEAPPDPGDDCGTGGGVLPSNGDGGSSATAGDGGGTSAESDAGSVASGGDGSGSSGEGGDGSVVGIDDDSGVRSGDAALGNEGSGDGGDGGCSCRVPVSPSHGALALVLALGLYFLRRQRRRRR